MDHRIEWLLAISSPWTEEEIPRGLSPRPRIVRGEEIGRYTAVAIARRAIALFLRGWLKFYHRFTIIGLENLPKDGPFILIANHASHLDTVCLQALFSLHRLHCVFPVASAKYFFHSLHRRAVAVIVTNAIPLHSNMHLRGSLNVCDEILSARGNVLILYPEGTRSTSGEMGLFRPGIGAIVAGTEVPVVPCYLDGAGKALAKGRWFPRPCKIQLTVGVPRNYSTVAKDKIGHHRVSHDLQQAVRELAEASKHTLRCSGNAASFRAPTISLAGRKR